MKPSVRASSIEGLRRELKDLRRSIMDLQRMGGGSGGTDQPGGTEPDEVAGGGVPTLYVAASNATDRSKEYADYICDGTDDEAEINAALTAVFGGPGFQPLGGIVVLSEGEFLLSAAIDMGSRVALHGMGFGTVLYPAGLTAIATDDHCLVRDLHIFGNNSSATGIRVEYDHTTIENVATDEVQVGIELAAGGTRSRVVGCRFGTYSSAVGIWINGADDCLITENQFGEDLLIEGDRNLVTGNNVLTGIGVTISSGTANSFASNYIADGAAAVSDSGTTTQFGTNFSAAGTW